MILSKITALQMKMKNTFKSGNTIPNIQKRQLMNTILLRSVYGSCGTLLFCYLDFFCSSS